MEMENKSNVLKFGEIGEQKYPWKNIGEPWTRMKVSRFIYFATWDWTIGVGTYTDEFMDTVTRLEASARQRNITLFKVLIVTLAAAVLIWMAVAKRITRPIVMISDAA
jgi:methyl-accepting chemotaxis protein